MDIVLLFFRIVVGGLFFGHGTQKLFGWFDGHGLDKTGGFFESLGYRPGRRAALAAGLTEAAGGALIALGLFTPLGAAMIVGAMVNAIVAAHAENGVWATNGGYELPLVYIAAALAITATGPGVFSADALYGMSMWGGAPAILAAALGGITGAVVLGSRKEEEAAEEEAPSATTSERKAA